MNLSTASVLLNRGLIREGQVVEAAVAALADDSDSSSLRLLAGLIPAESDQTRSLLQQTLIELGVPEPDAWTSFEIASTWRAEEAIAGRRNMRSDFIAIVHETSLVYFELADARSDPAERPPEVQRLLNETDIADVLQERGGGAIPAWLDERCLRHAREVLRALAGERDWPTSDPWEGVEWTGTRYRPHGKVQIRPGVRKALRIAGWLCIAIGTIGLLGHAIQPAEWPEVESLGKAGGFALDSISLLFGALLLVVGRKLA